MDGQTFRTYEETSYEDDDVVFVGETVKLKSRFSYPFNMYLSTRKEGIKYYENGLLPYFATLTQDHNLDFEKRKYPNCQLMMELKGGYKQFKNLDNNETLLIAMNSHTYEKNHG